MSALTTVSIAFVTYTMYYLVLCRPIDRLLYRDREILILNNSSLLYSVMADAVVVVHSPSQPPKNNVFIRPP